jgi:hypothetical protein
MAAIRRALVSTSRPLRRCCRAPSPLSASRYPPTLIRELSRSNAESPLVAAPKLLYAFCGSHNPTGFAGRGMKAALLVALALACSAATAMEQDVICTYAQSQSTKAAAIAGAATGGAATTSGALAAATRLTAVAHSSGAWILTGPAGYIAGTLRGTGATVAAAPFIVGDGMLVAGTAVTIDLVCANQNHPEQAAKIVAAAGIPSPPAQPCGSSEERYPSLDSTSSRGDRRAGEEGFRRRLTVRVP